MSNKDIRGWLIRGLETLRDKLDETIERMEQVRDGVDTASKDDTVQAVPVTPPRIDRSTEVANPKEIANPQRADIQERVALVKIQRKYHADMSAEELYQATKRCWRGAVTRLNKTEYVFAVHDDVIVEVYRRTGDWYPVTPSEECRGKRYEFDGEVAGELQHYVGQGVEHYYNKSSNPLKYVNV
jgi:hypothetical protein